jgi:CMP-N-acetylneuraminic acid synthetase
MKNEKLVVAVIRINAASSAEALSTDGTKTMLAVAIESARHGNEADVVVVLSDDDLVLAEASENMAVNREVPGSISDAQALELLLDSEEGFIDETQEVEFVWFSL